MLSFSCGLFFESQPLCSGCGLHVLFPNYYVVSLQVDICTNSQEQHRLWFGWVESRMRVLIQSLEQPPFVFCHPNANCFHRQVSRNDSQESDVQMESFVSTYFLGLSFKNGLRSVNLTASIQVLCMQWNILVVFLLVRHRIF